MSEVENCVIDNGSGMCKAGFGGEDNPRVSIPAIIGVAKQQSVMPTSGHKEFYVGQEAQDKRGILSIRYPVKEGVIDNWEDMQAIWHHVYFNELRISPEGTGALLTEAPMNPRRNRERMAEIFFENFKVEKHYCAIQAILGLYSLGRTTGLVLDSGDGVTHTVPIFEGFSIPHAIDRRDFAGRSVTYHMQKLMAAIGCKLNTTAGFEIVRIIKEEFCYVAVDYAAECERYRKCPGDFAHVAELPDKTKVELKDCVFNGPECLFQPDKIGIEASGISQMILSTIKACDIDVRMDMYQGIALTGGTTMTKCIEDRIMKDLTDVSAANLKIKVIASPDRKYSVWMGGSILASLHTFNPSWVSKQEYEEEGSGIMHRKCF